MKRMFLLSILVSLAACGGGPLTPPPNGADAESGCVPGRSVECVGPGGCVSNQVCNADGRSFGPCVCASPADGGGTVGVNPGDGGGDDAGAFSSTRVASALAQCNLPHGPPVTVSTGNDVVAQATGAWLLCPAESSAIATLLSPGFVLGSGGQWYRLVDDGNGGLTAATGVQGQGPWSAFCEASSDHHKLADLHFQWIAGPLSADRDARQRLESEWLSRGSGRLRVIAASHVHRRPPGPLLRRQCDRHVRLLVGSALRTTRSDLSPGIGSPFCPQAQDVRLGAALTYLLN